MFFCFFFIFFLTAEVSHFLRQKIQKKYFYAKTILENIFLAKKMFLNFLSQKVTNSFSKKKNGKKYFYAKTILENIFLEKKNVFEFFVSKSD